MNLNEALFSLMHIVRNTTLHQLKALGLELSPMHLKSLNVISTIENCTGQKLADFLGRDKAQINRLIKELVNQEFVIKTNNVNDKRSQILTLTPQSEALIKQFKQVEKEVSVEMAKDISPEQIEDFIELTQQFKQNLNAAYQNKE